jgi:chitin disaccharide deacetylase
MKRYLIFNADDFGASKGVNRGIIDCHSRGVLTSASLMVTGRAVDEAVSLSREYPDLAVGLHWDVWGEDEREFDTQDLAAVRDEFHRQIEAFERLLGRLPTHVDSHRHAHREPHVMPLFREMVAPLGVPLRDDGSVLFVGGFYAQWEWMMPDLRYISVEFLQEMIRRETPPGVTEFSCHPGYAGDEYSAVYLAERETEVATLTDPRIRDTIEAEEIHLISYAEYARLRPAARVATE